MGRDGAMQINPSRFQNSKSNIICRNELDHLISITPRLSSQFPMAMHKITKCLYHL